MRMPVAHAPLAQLASYACMGKAQQARRRRRQRALQARNLLAARRSTIALSCLSSCQRQTPIQGCIAQRYISLLRTTFPAALPVLPSRPDTAFFVSRSVPDACSRAGLPNAASPPCGLVRRHSPQPATSNVAVHNSAHRGRCGPAVARRPHVRRRGLARARGECSPACCTAQLLGQCRW